jgi:predicted secreted hydrolase
MNGDLSGHNPKNTSLTRITPVLVDAARDLAAKKGVDSWFVVAKTQTPDGHEFSFMSHMMSFSLNLPLTPKINLTVNSITDKTTGWYSAKEYTYPARKVNISAKRLSVIMPNAKLAGTIQKMNLVASLPDGAIDVTMLPVGPILYSCSTGLFEMIGVQTYHFALPKMETTGTLTIKGEQYEVSGISWFDRQWVPKVPLTLFRKRNYKWTWMNLSLDNGDFISLWDVIDFAKGTENAWGTVLHPDGTHIVVPIVPIAENSSDYWRSPMTGQRYPTRFVVRIPSLDIYLEVVPTVREQEIVSTIDKKYEGACTLTGTYMGQKVDGWTYVEMVGKWD